MSYKLNYSRHYLFSLLLFLFSIVSFAAKIYEVDDISSFVTLGNGKEFYSDSRGRFYEIVLDEEGNIINSEERETFLKSEIIKQMIPFKDSGLILITNRSNVYLLLNTQDMSSRNVLFSQSSDLVGVANIGEWIYLLNTRGDLWGQNLFTGEVSNVENDPALSKVIGLIAVGKYLVFYSNNGRISKVEVESDVIKYNQRIEIGYDWIDAGIHNLDEKSFLIVSKGKYVRARQVSANSADEAEKSDALIGSLKQHLKLPNEKVLYSHKSQVFSSYPAVYLRRLAFFEQAVKNDDGYSLVNLSKNLMRGKIFPVAPIVSDYPSSKTFGVDFWGIAIKFDSSYFLNIPSSIRSEIVRHGISPERVEIFLHIQRTIALGEQEDHRNDGSPHTSRIKVHPWADPFSPDNFAGTRLERPFLIAIYEPEFQTIKAGNDRWALDIGELKEFEVEVHDGKYSPQTARIQLGTLQNPDPQTQAFWSVAVDHLNPVKKRAAVTLHWLVSPEDVDFHEPLGEIIQKSGVQIRTFAQLVDAISRIQNAKKFLSKLNGLLAR